jgi:hypothetical protein
VACAASKAIQLGNPETNIGDDKTLLEFVPEVPVARRKRPGLVFESAVRPGKKIVNTIYLVEITTPWSWDGTKGNNGSSKV